MTQGKRMVDDLFKKNFLKLNIKFFSGKNQLNQAKRRRKKVISMPLPPGVELVLAAGAVPIFLCRVGDYSSDPLMRGIRFYKNIFGWNLLANGVRFLRPLLGDQFFSDSIDKLLTNLYATYDNYVSIAEDEGSPLDACFGTRLLLGATWPQLKKVHGTIGYATRCNWFSKVFEEIEERSKVILLEVPLVDNEHGREMMNDSLNQAIAKLEQITGNTITNEKLRKQIVIGNKLRKSYLEILEIWMQNKIRLSPLTFTNLLSLLHIGFTDFLCEPKFFLQTLQQLVKEMQKIPTQGGYDTSSMPKLVLVNAFGGYDPHLPEIVDQLGGRLLIADWEVLKVLDNIETEGDIMRNYAQYLIRWESAWMDNTTLVDRYIDVASKYEVDGILFNSIYGCKSITPSLRLFKDKLHKLQSNNLRLVDIGFQNIGDNLEQVKTRISAIFEIIQSQKA